MKMLCLVRHAKSSWKFPDLDDFERPLNKRGKRDAPAMGHFLKDKNIRPDIIISSPAIRASVTTKIISKILAYPLNRVKYTDDIYESDITSLLKVVQSVKDKYKSAMIVGHNPALTNFANLLTNSRIDNIPTCGILCANLAINSWLDVAEDCGSIDFFKFPKNI
jgi:phosphohistidine phosphatase